MTAPRDGGGGGAGEGRGEVSGHRQSHPAPYIQFAPPVPPHAHAPHIGMEIGRDIEALSAYTGK